MSDYFCNRLFKTFFFFSSLTHQLWSECDKCSCFFFLGTNIVNQMSATDHVGQVIRLWKNTSHQEHNRRQMQHPKSFILPMYLSMFSPSSFNFLPSLFSWPSCSRLYSRSTALTLSPSALPSPNKISDRLKPVIRRVGTPLGFCA